MTNNIDHDRLFKELISTFFIEFIELFFPQLMDYLDRDSITFLDKEVFTDVTEGERHESDLVAQVKFRGKEITAQNVIDAFKTLQARGIGIFEERKNKKGPSTKIFIKNKIENDTSNKDDLIDFLETIDIDLLTYNEQIEKKSKFDCDSLN